MKASLPFLCMVLLFNPGCSSSHKAEDIKENHRFNKWLHHSRRELIAIWGAPDSVFADGHGGEILLYKEALDYKSVMNRRYTGKQFSFRKEMFVNADSSIYDWRAWRRK